MSSSELPKGWKECKLGQVISFGNGKCRPKIEGVYPVYGGNGILGYVDSFNYSDETIILGRVGAYCGSVYYEDRSIWISDNALSAKPKESNHIKFLYYFLKYLDLNSHAGGSSHPLITQSLLNSLDIEICVCNEEQKSIAEVLSSLDDKIDLLHQQNQTLEDMAQTLFREWFIEKADEGWEEVKLGDYINCHNGFSYKSSDLSESKNALVTLKNFARDGTLRLDGFKEFTSIKYKDSQIVRDGDLVVSHTDITQEADIIGNPIIIQNIHNYNTLVITMDLVKVESKFDWLSKNYLYCLFKSSDFKFHCLCNSNGSTVLHMSKKALPEYIFKLPSIDTLKRFTLVVDDIFRKKIMNQKQIKSLEQTRDTLLPKLMSGEVRV
ncbi:restriction endonuclease subunit S [Francisellaceae bacterium CB299]